MDRFALFCCPNVSYLCSRGQQKQRANGYNSMFFAGGKFIYFCKDEVQVSSLGDKFYSREEKSVSEVQPLIQTFSIQYFPP